MSATRKPGIYLGKGGKVFGPFTEPEFEAMHTSGQIQNYNWMWDFSKNQWKPMDPPPAPLVETVATGAEEQLPPKKVVKIGNTTAILAVCHDFHAAVSGKLENVTASGCELSSAEDHASPPFSTRSQVHLNLLNSKSGEAMNVEARLYDVQRHGNTWRYKLRWEECPEILQ